MWSRVCTLTLSALSVLPSCTSEPFVCESPHRLDDDGVCRRYCTDSSSCLLTEVCEENICKPTGHPIVLEFIAVPSFVTPGSDVELRYTTLQADRVQLRRIDGADDVEVLLDDTQASGQFVLQNVQESMTIELLAENENGDDSLEVMISVEHAPTILSFEATPDSVTQALESVELSWEVQDADWIEIRANDLNPPIVATDQPTGTFSTPVSEDTTFWLYAFRGLFETSRTLMVTVRDGRQPVVVDAWIDAPSYPLPGDVALLGWRTENALSVIISRDGVETVILDPRRVDEGAAMIRVSTEPISWKIIANRGADSSEPKSVGPLHSVPGVTIQQFAVTPQHLSPSSEDTEITAQWQIRGSILQTVLTDPGGNTEESSSNEGMYSVSVATNRPAIFRLDARDPRGFTASDQATAWPLRSEEANHEQRDMAQPMDDFAISGTLSNLLMILDPFIEDWYVLDTEEQSTLRILAMTDPMCPDSFEVELFQRASETPEIGIPLPTPENTHAFYVPSLPGGDVLIRVATDSTDVLLNACSYTLFAEPFAPMCGNRMIDHGETCDDGGAVPRDGCGFTCLEEAPDKYAISVDDIINDQDVGTPVTLWKASNDSRPIGDEGFAVIPLPFDFPFYGKLHRAIQVSTNGFAKLSPANASSTADEANDIIALFARDLRLDPQDPTAGIFIENTASAEPGLIIAFNHLITDSISEPVSGQITLYASGRIELSYPGQIPSELGTVGVGIHGQNEEATHTFPGCTSPGLCLDPSVLSQSRLIFEPADALPIPL